MYFQQDNAACHKAQIISDWFLEHDNEFTLLKWSPQSPDLNPIEHLCDVVEREIRIMDVQQTKKQQLRDAIMSIWTKISEECFQHLVESMPRRIKTVLKTKGVQPGTSKVYLIKWPVRVVDYRFQYIYIYIFFFNHELVVLTNNNLSYTKPSLQQPSTISDLFVHCKGKPICFIISKLKWLVKYINKRKIAFFNQYNH